MLSTPRRLHVCLGHAAASGARPHPVRVLCADTAAVHAANISWTVKTDECVCATDAALWLCSCCRLLVVPRMVDRPAGVVRSFFPHSFGPHAYVTGYFTSRPTLKRYVRETEQQLQVSLTCGRFAPAQYRGGGGVRRRVGSWQQ